MSHAYLGLIQPALIWLELRYIGFEFGIVDDAARFQIDKKHLAGLQAPFLDDLLLRYIQHTHLGGHHNLVIISDKVARGA